MNAIIYILIWLAALALLPSKAEAAMAIATPKKKTSNDFQTSQVSLFANPPISFDRTTGPAAERRTAEVPTYQISPIERGGQTISEPSAPVATAPTTSPSTPVATAPTTSTQPVYTSTAPRTSSNVQAR